MRSDHRLSDTLCVQFLNLIGRRAISAVEMFIRLNHFAVIDALLESAWQGFINLRHICNKRTSALGWDFDRIENLTERRPGQIYIVEMLADQAICQYFQRRAVGFAHVRDKDHFKIILRKILAAYMNLEIAKALARLSSAMLPAITTP